MNTMNTLEGLDTWQDAVSFYTFCKYSEKAPKDYLSELRVLIQKKFGLDLSNL